MRAVNADDLIHELDKDGIVEHGYVSVFGIPIIEDCVPVVRCKDCKHWQNKHVCSAWSRFGTIETKGDQFCSYGEKVTE